MWNKLGSYVSSFIYKQPSETNATKCAPHYNAPPYHHTSSLPHHATHHTTPLNILSQNSSNSAFSAGPCLLVLYELIYLNPHFAKSLAPPRVPSSPHILPRSPRGPTLATTSADPINKPGIYTHKLFTFTYSFLFRSGFSTTIFCVLLQHIC